ncbi:MAG: hydrogenase maturation nickel metallochaperone HypA/HybF [Promethearchaeota archaeon]
MHEFSFASHLIQVVMNSVKKNGVKRVRQVLVEVGEFTMIIPSFLETCYDIIKENYPEIQDSTISIKKVPGEIKCNECAAITTISFDSGDEDDAGSGSGLPSELARPSLFKCEACGSTNTTIVSGKQTLIKSMMVDD